MSYDIEKEEKVAGFIYSIRQVPRSRLSPRWVCQV